MPITHRSRTISVTIEHPFEQVYVFLAIPTNFPKWASGLGVLKEQVGTVWNVESPEGMQYQVRFAEANPWGVLDHYVILPTGEELYIPMRVIRNGEGSEVMLTLLLTEGMTGEKFEQDAIWVAKDLQTLKGLLEA